MRSYLEKKEVIKLSDMPSEQGPLISIIIPVYNVKPYIYKCLDSVINQTYKSLEILVVDDGSTDGCGSICDEFAKRDARFVVFHTDNNGLSAARNYGLDHMSSDSKYVAFLDSDDWIEKDTIQKLYESANKYLTEIVSCQYFKEMKNKTQLSNVDFHSMVLDNDQIMKVYVQRQEIIGQMAWNKLYSVSLFSSVRYPVGRVFEDIATTYKLVSMAHSVVVLTDRLIHYRIRSTSISRDYSMKNMLDYWAAYYEKYCALSRTFSTPEYVQPLVGECLLAINRMWRGYGGCTKQEKEIGLSTLFEMKKFAKSHRKSVWCGKNFTTIHRISCLLAMTSNPFLLWIISRIYKAFCFVRRTRFA